MAEALYTLEILRLASAIPHQLSFDDLGNAEELRSPTCGSRLRLVLAARDGRVTRVSQAVEACAFGQAAASLVGAHAPGMKLDDLRDIDARIAAWLADGGEAPWPGLDALAPARAKTGRHGAILLPFRALAREAERAGR
jgi:NifU-like protein involved in Fe-S cluster formation